MTGTSVPRLLIILPSVMTSSPFSRSNDMVSRPDAELAVHTVFRDLALELLAD
jgi:hypothetical protein